MTSITSSAIERDAIEHSAIRHSVRDVIMRGAIELTERDAIERDNVSYILTFVPESQYVDYATALTLADERCEEEARRMAASAIPDDTELPY